jgi:hypothetical protein
MYKSVHDLSRDQLEELKSAYFYNDDPEITDNLTAAGIEYPEQIPDDIIFHEYGGISFVNDDFSCSAGRD